MELWCNGMYKPARESIDFVDALSVVMTGAFEAIILIDFAQQSFRSVRTRAVEPIDLVVTSASVMTRVVGAIVYVELTLSPLETRQTVAGVMTALIVARSAVSEG